MRFSISIILCAAVVLGPSPAVAKLLPVDDEMDNMMFPSSMCPLKCDNGAECVKIKKERPPSQADGESEWECVCPRGYGGRICEAQKRRGLADPVTCGNLQCLNGGTCGAGQNYTSGDAVCDCSGALLVTSAPFTLRQFVGQSCEIEVIESDYCAGSKDLFCVNGGACRNAAADFEDFPCNCTSAFKGRHCEYSDKQVQNDCILTCNGAGTCQHGFTSYGDSGANALLPSFSEGTNLTLNFMHCVCDSGFAGPNCEYEYVKCGGKNGYCFHGATCAAADSDNICDCPDRLNSTTMAGGQNCEYLATNRCNKPNEVADAASQGVSDTNLMDVSTGTFPFCVNDGECYKVMNTEVYYCKCDPGWSGTRCEYANTTTAPNASPAPSEALTESPYPTIFASITESPAPTIAPNVPTPYPTWEPTFAPNLNSWSAESTTEGTLDGGAKFGVVFAVFLTMGVVSVVMIYFNRRAEYLDSMVYQDNDNIPEAHVVNMSLPAEEELTTEMTNVRPGDAPPTGEAPPTSGPSNKEIV